MKLLKKIMLTIALLLGLTIGAYAQSGWNTGEWYQYQGETWTEWQTVITGYDFFGNPLYSRKCRQTTWYSESYSGYVYVWGPNGWYTQWYSGYAWKCYWSNWYWC